MTWLPWPVIVKRQCKYPKELALPRTLVFKTREEVAACVLSALFRRACHYSVRGVLPFSEIRRIPSDTWILGPTYYSGVRLRCCGSGGKIPKGI